MPVQVSCHFSIFYSWLYTTFNTIMPCSHGILDHDLVAKEKVQLQGLSSKPYDSMTEIFLMSQSLLLGLVIDIQWGTNNTKNSKSSTIPKAPFWSQLFIPYVKMTHLTQSSSFQKEFSVSLQFRVRYAPLYWVWKLVAILVVTPLRSPSDGGHLGGKRMTQRRNMTSSFQTLL